MFKFVVVYLFIHSIIENTLAIVFLMVHITVIVSSQCLVYLRKEGNFLFNDALNTFCLCLYGIAQIASP